MDVTKQIVKILIIDYPNDLRRVVEEYLREQPNIKVITVNESIQAWLEKTDDTQPDIVVLNLRDQLRADVNLIRNYMPEVSILLIGDMNSQDFFRSSGSIYVDSYVTTSCLFDNLIPELMRISKE